MFGLPGRGKESSSHSQYVRHLKSHLEESYQDTIENSQGCREKTRSNLTELSENLCKMSGTESWDITSISWPNINWQVIQSPQLMWLPSEWEIYLCVVWNLKKRREHRGHNTGIFYSQFLPETEREEKEPKSSPKRHRTRQQGSIQQEKKKQKPFASDDDDNHRCWHATALPAIADTVVKIYHVPKHNLAPAPSKLGGTPAKPHPSCTNMGLDPGAARELCFSAWQRGMLRYCWLMHKRVWSGYWIWCSIWGESSGIL